MRQVAYASTKAELHSRNASALLLASCATPDVADQLAVVNHGCAPLLSASAVWVAERDAASEKLG